MPRLDDVMWRLVQGMTTRRAAVVIIMVKEAVKAGNKLAEAKCTSNQQWTADSVNRTDFGSKT